MVPDGVRHPPAAEVFRAAKVDDPGAGMHAFGQVDHGVDDCDRNTAKAQFDGCAEANGAGSDNDDPAIGLRGVVHVSTSLY